MSIIKETYIQAELALAAYADFTPDDRQAYAVLVQDRLKRPGQGTGQMNACMSSQITHLLCDGRVMESETSASLVLSEFQYLEVPPAAKSGASQILFHHLLPAQTQALHMGARPFDRSVVSCSIIYLLGRLPAGLPFDLSEDGDEKPAGHEYHWNGIKRELVVPGHGQPVF